MAIAAHLATFSGWALIVLSAAGSVYTLAAAWVLARFAPKAAPRRRSEPATLLKPLYGAEPRLFENLATFCSLDHGGPVQIVFGIQRADDPAHGVVAALRERFADVRIDVATTGARNAANGKVANLVAMAPLSMHDVLVLSDSDIAAPPDYLAHVLDALDAPGVGAVTCAYRGRGDAGFWSRLGAAGLDWQMLPGVVFGMATGLATPCMGSTIALRRDTLAAIGGFETFTDTLADDYAIGAAVRTSGQRVALSPLLVAHGSAEASFEELWRHEVRWSATVRGVEPVGHALSVIAMPLPLALLALPLAPVPACVAVLAAWLARAVLVLAAQHVTRSRPLESTALGIALLPIRDILSFAVYSAAFTARSVDWRGAKLAMKPEGRIETGAETTQ